MLNLLFERIRNFIQRCFFPITFDLEEEYSDILAKDDEIQARNVLVGTIRNKEQLTVNLTHKFYHIPLNELITDTGIEYVALYQSKNLFSNDDITGIKYFGKVSKSTVLPRCAISEIPKKSSELYVRFDIEEWQELNPRIKIWEFYPKVFFKTSSFLLKDSHYTNKLSIENAEEYILYSGIWDIVSDLYDGFKFRKYTALRRGKRIIIKLDKSKTDIKIKDFLKTPLATFKENFKKFDKNY